MKRILASVATTALALGGLAVATAMPASAHTPAAVADCHTLTVDLQSYDPRGDGENIVTITVDGNEPFVATFGASYDEEFDLGDPTEEHTWEVKVDAIDGDKHNFTDNGTSTPCVEDVTESEVETGLYLYEKMQADADAGWWNSHEQTLVTHRDGDNMWQKDELPLADFSEALESEICGPGWAVQQDVVTTHEGFEWPETIQPPQTVFNEKLVRAQHIDLSELVEVPDCVDDAPSPSPSVTPEPTPSAAPTVAPDVPEVTDVCGTENDILGLPTDADGVTYESTADGFLARAVEGFELDELPAGYESVDATTAHFPISAANFTDEECELIPGDIAAVCDSATPYLAYGVTLPDGIDVDSENPLSITFINPDGDDYVATEQPLEGRLLWPGASASEPLQWPGYELQDGTYVETDGNFAWTRDGVDVKFEVNPDYSTVVNYPPASEDCANPPSDSDDVQTVADDVEATPVTDEPELAMTGATVGVATTVALLLIAGGVTLFVVRRRLQSR